MNDLEYFQYTLGLRDQDVVFIPYGSRVYGTHSKDSDYDYMAIVPPNRKADTGTEWCRDKTNIHVYNRCDFQHQLKLHKVHALEGYFCSDSPCPAMFDFKLSLPQLRRSFAEKASHSFVKAKKKIEVERDYYIGWKSLFHSLRILRFGIQIAREGRIVDFAEANQFWFDILNGHHYGWPTVKEIYQPIYNGLASEFRSLAPKE